MAAARTRRSSPAGGHVRHGAYRAAYLLRNNAGGVTRDVSYLAAAYRCLPSRAAARRACGNGGALSYLRHRGISPSLISSPAWPRACRGNIMTTGGHNLGISSFDVSACKRLVTTLSRLTPLVRYATRRQQHSPRCAGTQHLYGRHGVILPISAEPLPFCVLLSSGMKRYK